jgi:hypothetical protein
LNKDIKKNAEFYAYFETVEKNAKNYVHTGIWVLFGTRKCKQKQIRRQAIRHTGRGRATSKARNPQYRDECQDPAHPPMVRIIAIV